MAITYMFMTNNAVCQCNVFWSAQETEGKDFSADPQQHGTFALGCRTQSTNCIQQGFYWFTYMHTWGSQYRIFGKMVGGLRKWQGGLRKW